MKTKVLQLLSICLFGLHTFSLLAQHEIPYLEKIGDKYQLLVEGKPFIMLGGELGNSTATTTESMKEVWPRLQQLNLNTILAPVYWELLEPVEGKFDYQLIDELIIEARRYKMKIVFLWFGSWKNSMSSHVPAWVKLDQKRFPRAKSKEGISQEILTPFSNNNLQADLNAYKHLMKHIKEFDGQQQTVILMQPENEIGMLPSARDHHPLANKKYKEDVPAQLIDYLLKNKSSLNPEFFEIWKQHGFQTSGNWENLFGKGVQTEEIFMAYYFALYTNRISEAGKQQYNIPSYVNAALNATGKKPGQYPSAGPLPHLLDIWKAACKTIDFYAPDFYNPRFKHWNDLYVRQSNPLFVPEHRFDNTVAAKALFAMGHYEALGFSPFSIEQIPGTPLSAKEQKLAIVYDKINQVKPLLDKFRGQQKVEGVLLDKEAKEVSFTLGNYEFTAGHTYNLGWEPNSKAEVWEPSGAIIIQVSENEFFYVGFGVSLKFQNVNNKSARVGILKAERGSFVDGEWTVYQHLNGDQTHQGRHIRSFVDDVCIQRFMLYKYE